MRVPYPPDQKATVLAQLEANGWNVSLTSQETGIPQRTLYHWRWQKWQQLQRQTPSPSAAANFATGYNFGNEISPPLHAMERGPGGEDLPMRGPGGEDLPTRGPGGEDNSPESDIAALSNLRRHLLDELVAMSADLERGLKLTSPYQKVLILTQLLDRLMKLDEHLKPYQALNDDNVIRIEYGHWDGVTRNVPSWYQETKAETPSFLEPLDTGDPDW